MNEINDSLAWLEQEDGERLDVGSSFSIGRSSGCSLKLSDSKVSRKHASIHRQGETEFWISDLGSANGTFVNQNRINQPLRLRNGDDVRIGPFKLKFMCPSDPGGQTSTQLTTQQTLIDLNRENRWLMVADIENSTMLASSLDAKIYRSYVDEWFKKSRDLIVNQRGSINKFLGDGFLACWPDLPESRERVGATLAKFREMSSQLSFTFRIVLHFGEVLIGGVGTAGEESISGPEVNFVFRMEKVAGTNGVGILLSQPAADELGDESLIPAGEYPVPGFQGDFRFATFP
jgi:class 3 adenylate cyclase